MAKKKFVYPKKFIVQYELNGKLKYWTKNGSTDKRKDATIFSKSTLSDLDRALLVKQEGFDNPNLHKNNRKIIGIMEL